MSRNRWGYMAHPKYNPPNDLCPDCTEPSKTFHIGGKMVDGVSQQRWRCANGHEWIVREGEVQAKPRPA